MSGDNESLSDANQDMKKIRKRATIDVGVIWITAKTDDEWKEKFAWELRARWKNQYPPHNGAFKHNFTKYGGMCRIPIRFGVRQGQPPTSGKLCFLYWCNWLWGTG
jgi:hypothetical protein